MERLIEKYMSLPNQAWDNIVKEATRVSNSKSCRACFVFYVVTVFSETCYVHLTTVELVLSFMSISLMESFTIQYFHMHLL